MNALYRDFGQDNQKSIYATVYVKKELKVWKDGQCYRVVKEIAVTVPRSLPPCSARSC